MIGCLVCVMNPHSQGQVKLTSADPLAPPVVGALRGWCGGVERLIEAVDE